MSTKVRAFGIVALVAGLLLVLAACGGGAKATPTKGPAASPTAALSGAAARGLDQYSQNCFSCHGAQAEGIPGLGKNLKTSTFVKGLSDSDLLAFITKGRAANDPANTTKVDMPPKGGNATLSNTQITDIIAYLRAMAQ